MTTGRCRVTVNGFRVLAETWEDVLQLDGKHDEVFVAAVAALDKNGDVPYKNEPVSRVMGHTNGQTNRVQATSGLKGAGSKKRCGWEAVAGALYSTARSGEVMVSFNVTSLERASMC